MDYNQIKVISKRTFRSLSNLLIHVLGVLHWTPTRRVGHQKFTSDDDDMILEYARKKGGVIVTRDQYRDSYDRCPEFKETIEKRYDNFSQNA